MMIKKLLVLAIPMLVTATNASGLDLDKVSELTESVCGSTIEAGSSKENYLSFDISDKSPEEVKTLKVKLSKYFDTVELNGNQLIGTTQKSSGMKQEEIAKHNEQVRLCRKEVGIAAIQANSIVEK